MLRSALILTALGTTPVQAQEPLCPEWSAPADTGALDVQVFPEASGLAVSADGTRLYLINDGSEPIVYVAAPDGSVTQTVRIAGFRPQDLEDLAVGSCPTGSCLFVADIGDNLRRRNSVQIAIVEDRSDYGATVDAARVVVARYPNGPHDAEAIAVDAGGDLWLVTKSPFGQPEPAQVFRLTAAALAADGVQTFEARGEIPIAALSGDRMTTRRVVTAMDIAPARHLFVLLTYDTAIEFGFDPGQGLPEPAAWQEGKTHRFVPITPLVQAEAIGYTDAGRSLIYTTESIRGSSAPLIRQSCR